MIGFQEVCQIITLPLVRGLWFLLRWEERQIKKWEKNVTKKDVWRNT